MTNVEKTINFKNEKFKSKIWTSITTIIKSLIVIFIIGVIMVWLSAGGAEVYQMNSSNRDYTGGWGYDQELNIAFGLLGIIIYIIINFFGFFSYNFIIKKFKNYNGIIGKIIFVIACIFINLFMLIIYHSLFGSYSFENSFFEMFNNVIVWYGRITFPVMFSIIYFFTKKPKRKI